MAFIPTPNAAKFSLNLQVDGDDAHCTGYVAQSSPFDLIGLTDVCSALITWWAAAGNHHMSSEIGLASVSAWSQESDTAVRTILSVSSPVVGAVAESSVPLNCAMVWSLRTANRGRGARGRMYIPGVPQTYQSTRTEWSGSDVAAVIADWQNMRAVLAGFGTPLVVVSHWLNKAPRTVGLVQQITDTLGDARICTQRRRLGKRL